MRAKTWTLLGGVFFTLIVISMNSWGQLQFTEFMNNSLDPDDADWEWVEVRNTSASPINMDGYVFFDESNHTPLIAANISAANSPTTIVPANGVAVLYNAKRLGADGARYRSAWNLSASTPLIGVSTTPGSNAVLNDGGDRMALWSSLANYNLDIAPTTGTSSAMIASPTMTSALLNFKAGFPLGAGLSAQWSGMGANSDGANWAQSVAGVGGGVTSVRTVTPSALVGVGNPGVVPAGPAASGLLITEIMYDPAAAEAANEWVEVYNNTGAAINFGTSPGVIFDHDTTALVTANLTSGIIPQGGTAILYSDDITPSDMQTAWGATNNYIPVSDWLQGSLGLANAGDEFGIWSSFASYSSEAVAKTYNLAIAHVLYSSSTAQGWPGNNNQGSIYLNSLTADKTLPGSWVRSVVGDGISIEARLALEDHSGGDVGSPGVFGGVTPTNPCDLNSDTVCNSADLRLVYDRIASGSATNAEIASWLTEAGTLNGKTYRPGDANLDGSVGGSDFTALASNFGASGLPGAYWDQGNFDGNAGGNFTVGGGDFTALASNFGSSSVAAVPEPNCPMWAAFVMLGLLARVRRAA